jgi:hypothetical protein
MGGLNDLENSEDRRSAGGHGNQHVRLRSAQIDEAICPALAAGPLPGPGKRPVLQKTRRKRLSHQKASFSSKIAVSFERGIQRPDGSPPRPGSC